MTREYRMDPHEAMSRIREGMEALGFVTEELHPSECARDGFRVLETPHTAVRFSLLGGNLGLICALDMRTEEHWVEIRRIVEPR